MANNLNRDDIDLVGGRYLTVDAIDEQAAVFYEHFGFHPCPGVGVRRLVRKTSDIAATLG